jgi:paraquat-inducible protein B
MRQTATKLPPTPLIQNMRWTVALIWLVPLLALGAAGFYLYDYLQNHGTQITINFRDGTGLKDGQTIVAHLGVQIGQVEAIELSPDDKQVLVHVRLDRSADAFAKSGALFWSVRPQVSAESISGLGTLASGPYIEATPGNGDQATEFTGLDQAPTALGSGLTIMLHAVRLERLQSDSPIYYRGFQVGVVQNIRLGNDATGIIIQAFIHRQYAGLVRSNSVFWIDGGIDVKGGILTGVQMKLESLRAVLSGGVAFATPERNTGEPAQEGTEFPLYEDAKPEWTNWSPRITLPNDDTSQEVKQVGVRNPQEAMPSLTK